MIGLALAVVRGHAGPEVIESAWKMDRIDVPRAPGLGLMLDEVSGLVGEPKKVDRKRMDRGVDVLCC